MALHRGKLAKAPRVLGVRPLEAEDVARLREKRVGPPRLQAIRHSHHRFARLVAYGYRDHQISKITGYSQQRITTLKVDPAVANLITQYAQEAMSAEREKLDEARARKVEIMNRVDLQIMEHLDRAEEAGELVPLKTLLTISADMSDRIGYGKHTSSSAEVIDIGRIMEAVSAASGKGTVIDAKASPVRSVEGGGPTGLTSNHPPPKSLVDRRS